MAETPAARRCRPPRGAWPGTAKEDITWVAVRVAENNIDQRPQPKVGRNETRPYTVAQCH
eukprot:10553255-Lingulodinium_polyedra.AAC.1